MPFLASYSLDEMKSIFIMQGFSGLSLFSVLLLMALGLAIIFGQMGVVNLAHGEFMALGAYMTYLCSQIVHDKFPGFVPYYFVVSIVVAFVVAAILGALVEWGRVGVGRNWECQQTHPSQALYRLDRPAALRG